MIIIVVYYFQMVEATTQLNYALNSNKTTITTNNGTTSTGQPVDQQDFNLIASNCNSNKCCFCSKVFTNVYNCRRHIRTHSGEKVGAKKYLIFKLIRFGNFLCSP